MAGKQDIASHLVRRRAERGLSRPDVSRLTERHRLVSAAYLKEVEDGRRIPSAKVLASLAAVYGDDPSDYLRLAGLLPGGEKVKLPKHDPTQWVAAMRGDPTIDDALKRYIEETVQLHRKTRGKS